VCLQVHVLSLQNRLMLWLAHATQLHGSAQSSCHGRLFGHNCCHRCLLCVPSYTTNCLPAFVIAADESKMELQGLRAYDAAVYCATLSAARRAGSSKGDDGRRHSTGGSAFSSSSSLWSRSRSMSCTGAAGSTASPDSSNSSSSGGGSDDGSAGHAGSNSSSSSEDGRSDLGNVPSLARRSWAADTYDIVPNSGAFGKFCLLQAAATHLLTSLRLLWQAPDDIDAFC
jgi:hypothetical protein